MAGSLRLRRASLGRRMRPRNRCGSRDVALWRKGTPMRSGKAILAGVLALAGVGTGLWLGAGPADPPATERDIHQMIPADAAAALLWTGWGKEQAAVGENA